MADGATSSDVVRTLESMCDEGLYLTAYRRAVEQLPTSSWTSPRVRALVARISFHAGAPRFARALDFETYRRAPRDPIAIHEVAGWLVSERGPLEAYRWVGDRMSLSEPRSEMRGRLLLARARCAGILRDFVVSEALIDEAAGCDGCEGFAAIERAILLRGQDKLRDALSVLEPLRSDRVWRRTATSHSAHLLVLLDRDREALDLLVDLEQNVESAHTSWQLATLQGEMHLHEDEARSLERFERFSPLIEDQEADSLRARRSDCAYHRGDRALALELARSVTHPFFRRLAEHLGNDARGDRRVLLDVHLVRQHHMTCVPATLTAVSQFWNRTADHLKVTEEICYDGTPAHSERAWAERNGWLVRELTVSWDASRMLLDRGIPFILSMTEASSGHAVAVIGYDERRGTLFCRDPARHVVMEMMAAEVLEHYSPYGPRGMAMVPNERADLLPTGLPDEEIFDRLHRLNSALVTHDRERASRELAQLREVAPKHRLTHAGRRALAAYDDDLQEVMSSASDLLALDARDARAELDSLRCARELLTHREYLERLERVVSREEVDSIYQEQLGMVLAEDERTISRAVRLLRTAVRGHPERSAPVSRLAELHLAHGRTEQAMELHRFAACLEETNESNAWSYFVAARMAGRTADAIRFLEERQSRLGSRATGPTRTLFIALDEVDATARAFDVLENALKARETDGELLLCAAEMKARFARVDEARAHLESARTHAHPAEYARTRALVHERLGEWTEEMDALRELLALEPASVPAHRTLTRRLSTTQGRAAAIEHLDGVHARFPFHRPLARLRILWLRDHDPSRAINALRDLIARDSVDAWARRELAFHLLDAGRREEATAESVSARALDPNSPSQHLLEASIARSSGSMEDAREACHRALAIDPDLEEAMSALFQTVLPLAARIADVERAGTLVFEKTVDGNGPVFWYEHARAYLDSHDLLIAIERFAESRPDLWSSWSLLVRHLVHVGRNDDACTKGEAAVERFPVHPRLWLDLASAREAARDLDGALDAIDGALRINPTFALAVLRKVDILRDTERLDRARAVLERAVALAPDEVELRRQLAITSWDQGEKERAVECIKEAIRFAPGAERCWNLLHGFRRSLGEPTGALVELQEHADARPWDATARMFVAHAQHEVGSEEAALESIQTALEIDPFSTDPHDLRATILANLGRHDEALAACLPPWRGPLPVSLQARAAWVEWSKGSYVAAIARMQDVVAENPTFFGAFRVLSEWCGVSGDHEAERRAAARMVEIAPEEADSHAHLGDALISLGDRAQAKESFVRALRASPEHGFAARQLLELHLADEEWDAAEKHLAPLARADRHAVALGDLRIRLGRLDIESAIACFERLCTAPETSAATISQARSHLVLHGEGDAALEVLRSLTFRGGDDVPKIVGEWWARTLLARGNAPRARELPLEVTSPAARGAVATTFSALIETRQRSAVRSLLLRGRTRLRIHTEDWANAGRALTEAGHPVLANLWYAGYRRRSDLAPWMLSNIALVRRKLGWWRRAFRLHRAALALPDDGTTNDDRVLVAFDDAASGRFDEASNGLSRVNEEGLDGYAKAVLGLTRAMIEVHGLPRTTIFERAAAFQIGRARLEDVAPRATLRAFAEFTTVWLRASRRIARDAYGLHAIFWAYTEWMFVLGTAFGIATTLAYYGSTQLALYLAAGSVAVLLAFAATRKAWANL